MTEPLDQTPEAAQATPQSMARNTIILMIAFATAKAISLAQTFIIASVFGVGDEWDAFVTANRIPEQIVLLIGGGALSYAFIPIFSSFLARRVRALGRAEICITLLAEGGENEAVPLRGKDGRQKGLHRHRSAPET